MKILSNIELSIVSCEIFALIVMLSIFLYLHRHRKTLSKSSTFFMYSVLSLCLGLIFDIFNFTFDGVKGLTGVLYITNYLSIVLADVIAAIFIQYIYSVACISDEKVSKNGVYIIFAISIIDFIYQTYGLISGTTIYLNENSFFVFNLKFYYILQLISMVVGIVYIVVNKRALKLNYAISFAIYYIVPLVASLITYIKPECMYMYCAIAISYTIVYIEIESRKERILINKIKYDPLTNLLNRSAFNDRLKEIAKSKDIRNVGIIFCDINGLKRVNDTQGHKAGDEYINQFASILTSNFRETGVFRLSGDEFIVLLNSISSNEFEGRLESFLNLLKENNDIASAGGAYGSVDNVNDLVDEAEKNMYLRKTEYYKNKK